MSVHTCRAKQSAVWTPAESAAATRHGRPHMSHDPRTEPRAAAIEQLESFCLSTYAARTFVALVEIGTGTAKRVSEVAEVPRTRVYDAVDELHDRGLAKIKQTSPRQFTAVSVETACRRLDNETADRLSVLTTALGELEPTAAHTEQQGVWTITDSEAITERVVAFVSAADDEIIYVANDSLLSESLAESLAAAADRGVAVTVGGFSADRTDQLRETIPTLSETDRPEAADVSRLLVVDGSKTLVSIVQSNPGGERAIWSVGDANSLVVVLRSLFGLEAYPSSS